MCLHMSVCRYQRYWVSQELEVIGTSLSWTLGPLQQQQMLLTTEPFPPPVKLGFNCVPVYDVFAVFVWGICVWSVVSSHLYMFPGTKLS